MSNLSLFLRMVKQAWVVILAFVIICASLAGIITRLMYKPEYTVTQVFTIELAQNPLANSATVSDNQLSKTVPSLLCSDVFMNFMQEYIEQSGVKGSFMVTSLDNTNLFYLTAKSNSNENAKVIINEIQKHYSEIANKIIGEGSMKFIAPCGESALPSNAPNYASGISIGALLAIVISVAYFGLKAYFTDTVNGAGDISELGENLLLGAVHRAYHKSRSGESKADRNRIPLVTDSTAQLKFCQEISTISAKTDVKCKIEGYKTVLVTSTLSGEGKSSISLNLACDLADKGKRVAIIDFDLRSPCIAQRLGITKTNTSLTDALHSKSNDIITPTCVQNLFFIGNTQSTSALLTRKDYALLSVNLEALKSRFDYIIIDTPPSDFLSDSADIGELCDAFIYVIAQNSVSKARILRALSSFDTSKCEMLGYVINFA